MMYILQRQIEDRVITRSRYPQLVEEYCFGGKYHSFWDSIGTVVAADQSQHRESMDLDDEVEEKVSASNSDVNVDANERRRRNPFLGSQVSDIQSQSQPQPELPVNFQIVSGGDAIDEIMDDRIHDHVHQWYTIQDNQRKHS
eukprot:30572_1